MALPRPDRGYVLVTGASTGIGRATAVHLDALGFRVIAAVRRETDALRVREEASGLLSAILLDVADDDSIEAARSQVEALVGDRGLAGLVNNAGIAVAGPLEFMPLDRLRLQFEVNYFGQIAVTQAFLPAIRRARGRVVNMSSIAGRVAPPLYGPYTSSKHALEAASDCLRNELSPWGIHVAVIEPGVISTPIWAKGVAFGRETVEALPEDGRVLYREMIEAAIATAESAEDVGLPPEKVAQAVAHALMSRRPRTRYSVGRDARLGIPARRLLPDRWVDRLLWRQVGLPGARRRF